MEVVTDEQVKTNLAANIRRLIESRGWSASRLARECHETQPTVSNILRGQHVPSIGIVTRIADALDTSVDYLLMDHGHTPVVSVANKFAESA